MFYLPQLGKSDCGVACLKMILADLNKDRQYLFLPCDENHGMYSFKDLQDIAKCHGLTLAGFKVTDKEEIRKCNLPAIIRMTTKENCHHAVVCVFAGDGQDVVAAEEIEFLALVIVELKA